MQNSLSLYFIVPIYNVAAPSILSSPRLTGMNEKVGLLSYRMDKDAFDKPYSEETAQLIDNEVRAFVDMAYKRTLAIVEEKRSLIEGMSMDLLKKEVGSFPSPSVLSRTRLSPALLTRTNAFRSNNVHDF